MMQGLVRLAEVPEYVPHGILVVGDRIICSACGEPAITLHLVPDGDGSHCLKAGCEDHDPDGYWFTVKDLANQIETWLPHLAEKRGRMLEALVNGLGEDGLKLIIQMRCSR